MSQSYIYQPPDGGGGQPPDSNGNNSTRDTNTKHSTTYANRLRQNLTNTNNTTIIQTKQAKYYPKKDQAIIIHAMNEIPLKEYIFAIGDIIKPENITHASRISNQRICIFLKTKSLVDQIVTEHEKIQVQNHITTIRRYIIPPTKVSITNICPSIPDEEILNAFKHLNIKVISPITTHRANLERPEYAHILCFRRILYIPETEKHLVPETLTILYENKEHRIFLATEKQVCNKCNGVGHPENKCKNTITPESTQIIQQNLETETTQITQKSQPEANKENHKNQAAPRPTPENMNLGTDPTKIIQITEKPQQVVNKENDKKRAAPSSPTLENDAQHTQNKYLLDTIKEKEKTTQSRKKKKQLPYNDSLELLRTEVEENPENYILSFDQIKDLLENILASNHPLDTIEDYTDKEDEIIPMLQQIYDKIDGFHIKNKITRTIKKLKTAFEQEQENTDDPYKITNTEPQTQTFSSIESLDSMDHEDHIPTTQNKNKQP